MSEWVRRQVTQIEPDGAGWRHAGLRVAIVEPGMPVAVDTTGVETIVLPLSGACEVRHDGQEEIYYFEVDGGGPAYQRVYQADPQRPIDVLAEVRSGDAVLVPYGWHGPSIATPGHDLFYLNVMAGEVRAWRICDDSAFSGIRATWAMEEAAR
jgi:5-deoxy-D-glucuronate isomerase